MRLAYAHTGGEVLGTTLADYLDDWIFDPLFLIPLVLALLYFRGLRRVPMRAGGRFGRWRPVAFAAGIGVLALSLLSPIDALADISFFWHMMQHDLLVLYGTPLILLGAPFVPVVRGLPQVIRRGLFIPFARAPLTQRFFRMLTQPVLAFVVLELWIMAYHLPAVYDLALNNDAFHAVAHALLVFGAVLFWWNIITPYPFRLRLHPLLGCLMLFGASVVNAGISSMISFSGEPIYQYVRPELFMGLTAQQDQSLGAVLMWVMGGMFRLIVIIVIAYRFAMREELKEPRMQPRLAGASAVAGN